MDSMNLKTPCFVVDEDKLKSNIYGFLKALNKHYKKNILGYSIKTNSLPYMAEVAYSCGCYAEVVSADEFELAKKIGFPINRIIYNGPMKTMDSFVEAIKGGAYVNIENFREIDWLKYVPSNRQYHIGVRVNIDFDNLGLISEKNIMSRFGFSYENGEFYSAVKKIQDMGFMVSGVHAHRTSTTRSIEVYQRIGSYISDILNELDLDLEYIDIGGGFYGDMPGKPDYEEYVENIKESLNICRDDVTLIVEPGNAICASPVEYILTVLDCKRIGERYICSTDGSRLDIDPFFHKESYWYECDFHDSGRREVVHTQWITGATCLENDIIMKIMDKRQFYPGDRIRFQCVGAYTMALTPNFINYLPIVYKKSREQFVIVRDKWTADLYMKNNYFNLKKKEKDSILFTNAGRRGKLISDFVDSIGEDYQIVATDNWSVAPALFKADKYYLTPKITEEDYIDSVLDICKKENVKAVTSLIDTEIRLLAQNAQKFETLGVKLLCPSEKSAELCFDKFKMFEYLQKQGIRTVLTYDNLKKFNKAYDENEINFPVFIKPRTGSGSVGATRIDSIQELIAAFEENKYDYIIQEFMNCQDCDADVYIDTISHEVVAAFSKRKIETRIGGASKTISFKDEKLFEFIQKIVDKFEFSGAVDMDFFYKDGNYYLSEINPRFGGAYLHAYGAGVDFPKMIRNNLKGIENEPQIGNYKDGVIMLMYDEVVITDVEHLKEDYNNPK